MVEFAERPGDTADVRVNGVAQIFAHMSHAALGTPHRTMHGGTTQMGEEGNVEKNASNSCPTLPFALSGVAELPCIMAAAFLDNSDDSAYSRDDSGSDGSQHGTVVLHNKCDQEILVHLPAGFMPVSALGYSARDKGGWAKLASTRDGVPWSGPLTVLHLPVNRTGSIPVPALSLVFATV